MSVDDQVNRRRNRGAWALEIERPTIVFLSVFWDNSSRTHTGFLYWRMTKSFSVQRQAFTSSFKNRKLETVVYLSQYLREARGLLNDVIAVAMQLA